MDSYLSSEEEDGEDEETEESSCAETEDDSSSQLTQYNNDKLEEVCLGSTRLALPQGLCENEAIFKEFFSLDTWQNVLTANQREQLKQFLPNFPHDDEKEKTETVQQLFARHNFKFGNPLNNLFTQLHSGYLRPDIAKMRSLMKKAQYREYRYRQRRYAYRTMRSLLVSRRRLLAVASCQAPDTPPRVERLIPPPRISPKEQRARRRYFEELLNLRKAEGESSQSSEDENYPEGPPPRLSKKQKKQLSSMQMSLSPDLAPVPSTLNKSSSVPFQLEARVTSTFNPYEVTEESYKAMLMKHKKRRSHTEDHPELNIKGITLQDVAQRSQTSRRTPCRPPNAQPDPQSRSKKKMKSEPATTPPPSAFISSDTHNSPSIYSEDSCSIGFPEVSEVEVTDKPKRRKSVQTVAPVKQEILDDEEFQDWEETSVVETPPIPIAPVVSVSAVTTPVTTPIPSLSCHKTITTPNEVVVPVSASIPTATFQNKTPLKAIKQIKPIEVMKMPVAIEEAPASTISLTIRPELELTQETHVCFLSLVRDIICSTPDQRMGLAALEQRLRAWQESPISPLNDWYSLAPSWVSLLPSAVNFLSGDFPAETQPEDFVPYLEYKPHMQAYQWIGAGRDSDHHLAPLCTHWLERRNEVPTVPVREEEQTEEAGLSSPPPPRCPTTWQARSAVGSERDNFHAQEKRRYENPNRAFTYRMHGFESVVSPVKGAYAHTSGLTKPRGHTLLVPERPNYITILSLVRDAVARLPNGEGTRTDICELLRDSQYISAGAEENYLQSVVGGALDRLHYETDTCVKYDPKRKTWIYLHRNRTEEEFEKLHQQQSTQPKSKRPAAPRKASRAKAKEKEVKPLQVMTTTLASVLAPGRLAEQANVNTMSPTQPTPVAPVKASPVANTVPRTFTLSSGGLQVATSSGVIQVTSAPTLVGGSSLLTTSSGQTVKLSAVKKSTNLTTLSTAGLNPQTLAAARLMVSSSGTLTVNKPVTTLAATQQTKQVVVSSQPTTTPTTSAPLVLHPISRPGQGKGLLASVSAAQLVNVSQMQLVNAARALQQQQIQLQQQQLKQQQLQQTQSQTQALQQQAQQQIQQVQQQQGQQTQQIQIQIQQQHLKTQQIQQTQPQQIQIQHVQQKPVSKQVQKQQQVQKKRQIQQQIQLQIQQQQQQKFQQQKQVFEQKLQQIQVDSPQAVQMQTATKTVPSTLPAGVKLLSAQSAIKSFAGGGSPLHGTQAIFIKHSAGGTVSTDSQVDCVSTSSPTLVLGKSLQTGGHTLVKAGLVTTSSSNTLMTSRPHVITTPGGKPMVAKVLTNAQGQLISMESLLAHQKQQLAAAGATVRLPGAKPTQQASLIQLPGTGGVPQFAMVTQGGIVGPRLLQAAAQQFQQQQQSQQAAQQGNTIPTMRMVTPSNTGLNVATIGGQPVILASKTQGPMAGQNVFLASSGGGSPAVVLTSPGGLRTQQGGTLVLQPGGAQQIVLPHGFQSGTLNFKSLQGLQGIRVIPLAQATAAASTANTSMPKGRQQVYARIITPPNRVATAVPAATQSTESTSGNTDATE